MKNLNLNLWTPNELSFEVGSPSRTITGYAAVFYDPANPGSRYNPQKGIEFRINRGAFDSVMRNPQGIQAVMFHDMNRPVGIYGDNLSLSLDNVGLRFSLDLPNTSDGRDAWEMIGGTGGPRLVRGMSFTADRGFDKWTKEGDLDVLTFYRWASVSEITITNNPAFKGTSISWSDEAAKFADRERRFEAARILAEEIAKK